jgi:hypothetical protein
MGNDNEQQLRAGGSIAALNQAIIQEAVGAVIEAVTAAAQKGGQHLLQLPRQQPPAVAAFLADFQVFF